MTYSPERVKQDLQTKAFLFPKPSADSYATLIPLQNKQLQKFTVCLWTYSELTRGYSLFSYATEVSYNEILLFRDEVGQYSLTVGGEEVTFQVDESTLTPVHICATWASASGVAEIWINGKPLVRKIMQVGYTLSGNAKIILGQDQDFYGGGFDINQSFVGEIGNVNMWDYVLPPKEIMANCNCGNILNWKKLKYEKHGHMLTVPHFWV
ncbi:mucosal pentraxin-like [Trichosurus vulpecula]|uniref:mucosal pentraxin-like n=1 Tax=Trichosurus vulpecula TaxID=9337 RepID=UPI00186AF508|nr:mucosal pentraxin-like [Trichosurus vulpecula]